MKKITLFLLVVLLLSSCNEEPWVFVKKGEIEKVEYISTASTGLGPATKTIIYFKDGSVFPLDYTHAMKNRGVSIWKNTEGLVNQYRFEFFKIQ